MTNSSHISTLVMVGLFGWSCAQVQGSLFVSNLDAVPTAHSPIGSDVWIAQMFHTGFNPDGYKLDAIDLRMNPASGIPGRFFVSIYSKTGDPGAVNNPWDTPDSSLGLLDGPDPILGGIFTYTTTDVVLAPSAFYFAVVTSSAPVSEASYNWSAAHGILGDDGWVIDNQYFDSSDGSNWTRVPRQEIYQMAIHATPVPEPSALALVGLGAACLSLLRRWE